MFIWMDVFFLSFSGDFFKDSLPEAELYILARILHDWTDERCVELLQRIYKACKPGLSISECERDEKVGMVNSVTVPAYRRKWGLKADLGSDLAYASH